ncbi:hypothetical protein M422DRAFT_266936 [Sphaerobolus stellatus SS14]|uniref:Uncharacterized protein n=1 Tax=Sphaerobolus stellatus (strain SS14) TaxID=990650 RepID=A0A0C9TN44_SPHS4|nr:hypothetical protein M422DRAFT_266936 [Sphaerobolus stellatus SS14]
MAVQQLAVLLELHPKECTQSLVINAFSCQATCAEILPLFVQNMASVVVEPFRSHGCQSCRSKARHFPVEDANNCSRRRIHENISGVQITMREIKSFGAY